MKNKIICLMALMMLITMLSVSAQVIQTTAPNSAYQSLKISGDGTIMIAGLDGQGYVLSNDSGTTWSTISSPSCYTLAMNNDGSRIYCHSWAQNALLTSTDYGLSFTSQSKFGDPRSISTDDSGMTVLVGYEDANAYISYDGGSTWNSTGLYASGSDMSTDGQVILLAYPGINLMLSTDGGNTWTPQSTPGVKSWGLGSVAMSGDGQKILVQTQYELWLTLDTGNTWTLLPWTPGTYFGGSPAVSDDGSVITVIEGPYSASTVYVSLDDGANWFDSGMGQRWWNGLALTDNGYILASESYNGGGDGGIWLLNQTPACIENWTQINSSCNGHNYTTTYLDENTCGTIIDLPTNPANGTATNCTIPTTASTNGKTRYIVNSNGEVVGTMYGNQLINTPEAETPFLSIGGGERFDLSAWLKSLWAKWFGGN